MVRQEAGEMEYTDTMTDAGEFAGWDPYVIWLCKQFTSPKDVAPVDAAE